MPRELKLVIFDLDDTLIDTSRVFFDARSRFEDLMTKRGPKLIEIRRIYNEIEKRNLELYGYSSERTLVTMRETYERLAMKHGWTIRSSDLRLIFSAGSKTLFSCPKPLEQAEHAVSWCAARLRVGLLTRGAYSLQRAKINCLGISNHLDFVRIVPRKTTQVFCEVADELKFKPDECLSVGDSMRFDIIPALEAGMMAAHVHYPEPKVQWNHDKAGPAAAPFFKLKGVAEIPALVERLLTKPIPARAKVFKSAGGRRVRLA